MISKTYQLRPTLFAVRVRKGWAVLKEGAYSQRLYGPVLNSSYDPHNAELSFRLLSALDGAVVSGLVGTYRTLTAARAIWGVQS